MSRPHLENCIEINFAPMASCSLSRVNLGASARRLIRLNRRMWIETRLLPLPDTSSAGVSSGLTAGCGLKLPRWMVEGRYASGLIRLNRRMWIETTGNPPSVRRWAVSSGLTAGCGLKQYTGSIPVY